MLRQNSFDIKSLTVFNRKPEKTISKRRMKYNSYKEPYKKYLLKKDRY